MKLHLFAAAMMLLVLSCKTIEPNRNERKVERKNSKKADKGVLDKDVADFLVAAADSRLMGIKQGKLAAKRGNSESTRQYGKYMEDEQEQLLKEIKKLAKERKVTLPNKISAEKEDGLNTLEEKSGKAFDRKFYKMMKIDHKRDIKSFKNASELGDAGITAFTDLKLPLLQTHLDKLKSAKKSK